MSRRLLSTLAFTLLASFATPAAADYPPPRIDADAPVANTQPFAQPPRADLPDTPLGAQHLDRAAVRAKLAQQRAANLARFRAYQAKRAFPSNTFTDGKLNVWLDRDGRLCAAATIIQLSGRDALVAHVAATNNFVRLADVTDGALMDWMLTSGFTQDEIAAIQEPFMGVADEPALEPRPEPILVDRRLRRAEDRRLAAKYRQVERQLVKNAAKSLDRATDLLMARPDLARQLLDG